MVIKGKSRTNGQQLAAYLQKLDGNTRVEILEHISRHDTLADTAREWEILAEGVQGKKYLYHAQINPEARYDMTPEQWERSADVVEQELGLTGQPRFIVFHEKADGRQHAHVVWHRIDMEKMTLIDDSWNYVANERASLALEKEFGHEIVPGKHAKRDREQQPEFPRSEMAEHDRHLAERTGIDPEERKQQIIALKEASDTAQDFKAALEEAGYILARGDRGYLIVDGEGDHFTLARQLKEKTKEVNAFMAEVPLATLPALEDAKEQAKTLRQEASQQQPQPTEPDTAPEAFLKSETALKAQIAEDARQLQQRHKAEISQLFDSTKLLLSAELEGHRARQNEELSKFFTKAEEFSDDWIRKYADIRLTRWNWDVADQRRIERQQEIDAIRTAHRIERETIIQTLKQERDQQIEDLKAAAHQPPAPATAPPEPSWKLTAAEREAIRQSVQDRFAEDFTRAREFHKTEQSNLAWRLDQDIRDKLTAFDAQQTAERAQKSRELFPERSVPEKLAEAIKDRLDRGAARNDRDRQWDALIDRHEQQRTARLDALQDNKQRQIEELKERHAERQRDLKTQAEADLARYVREEEAARKMLAELDKQRTEELRQKRDGPGPPTPTQ